MYIWQRPDWPEFSWQAELLQPRLDAVRLLQGRLLGQSELLPADVVRQAWLAALVGNAAAGAGLDGAAIDGEALRAVAGRRLERPAGGGTSGDRLVDLLLDVVHHEPPLTLERLGRWQAAFLPPGSDAGLRREDLPAAPAPERLERELDDFLYWFDHPSPALDPLLRAGIAHLWFVTLHPFEPGSGRLACAVTDLALAQGEPHTIRFYALSAVLLARRAEYDAQLAAAQSGDLYIVLWLDWFLETLEEAMQQALAGFRRLLAGSTFWQHHARTRFNGRQLLLLERLLDGGRVFADGIGARGYQALTGASKPTATRDLADLLAKGCLQRLPGGGRSTRYALAREWAAH